MTNDPVDEGPCTEHEYCVPGCSKDAHCWKCGAELPQTAQWNAEWIDDEGIDHRQDTPPSSGETR